jgi:RNA polymerase sigma-70 factor, ECF subfamily
MTAARLHEDVKEPAPHRHLIDRTRAVGASSVEGLWYAQRVSHPGSVPRSSTDERDDPALVVGLRAGDVAAFETIIRQNGPVLLALARRLLRHDDDAREAVQEAFVSAFRASQRFEGASRISTWLHRIVVNACLMRLRAKRHVEVSIDEWLPAFLPDGHHLSVFVDWSEAAYTRLEQDETRRLVRECIDRLPDSYRTVLLMRDIEGLPVSEVAAALEISENAVHVRLHRARQALRTLLDPLFLRGPSS